MDGNIPYLSVVIPFYNEEESVGIVCSEVSEALTAHQDLSWELVMVDDGSTDRTLQVVDELARGCGSFQALHLSPNSGQSAALEAGFRAARGEMIATLDGDGQNDPGDIITLLDKMEKTQVHMMCGIRRKRSDNVCAAYRAS
jgi:glycosyltransferase involved in cell wall biosynthesis